MELSYWSVAILMAKWLSYMATATFAGASFITTLVHCQLSDNEASLDQKALQKRLTSWQLCWLIPALIYALLLLPIQAGAMADDGWQGMFEPIMLQIVWQSVIGSQIACLIGGLLFAICSFIVHKILASQWQTHSVAGQWVVWLMRLLALFLLAASFSLSGHVSELSIVKQILLTLHVIAIALWLGALWPLILCCKSMPIPALKALMQKFGQFAIIIVFVLVVCGLVLLLSLLTNIQTLFYSSYGQLMLCKLALVSSMLMLAAWHKLRLVPTLDTPQAAKRLQRSILLEGVIGLAVLLLTGIVTTLIGPAH
jgi:copper resistance protein D